MKLFLDDIRDPPDNTWSVARTYSDAVDLIRELGYPEEISFDHDLGDEKTGLDLAHYLIEMDLDSKSMPGNFSFSVHSANPVGRANIKALLDGYMRFRDGSS